MEILITVILIVLIIAITFVVKNQNEKQRQQKELEDKKTRTLEAARIKLYKSIDILLPEIEESNKNFEKYLNQNNGYFNNFKLKSWIKLNHSLFYKINNKSFTKAGFPNDVMVIIKNFISYYNNGEEIRQDFNKNFVKKEMKIYSSFFDNIEGEKLDNQQRMAIIKDEDNNIIIAGAGSGKTTTIVGKVQYVVDRYKTNPNNILLISFTKKSATTLAKRVNIENVVAKTFHKFGKDVIISAENKQPSIFEDKQFKPLLKKYFNDLLEKKDYLDKIVVFFLDFLKPYKSQFEFENQGDYIRYIKDQNLNSYKEIPIKIKGKITYKMEVVKSIEECKIANFLLFNGIEYKYELPYEFDTANKRYRQYKPDFTIIQNGKKIYLEHFGISRNNTVPHWFTGDKTRSATQKYLDDMEWKRDKHKECETILIETYSYEMFEGNLYKNLSERLSKCGIILKPKSSQEIFDIITKSAKEEYESFITLFGTFITLMKSNNYTFKDLHEKNKLINDEFQKGRNNLFIEIIIPIYEKYQTHLATFKELDFSDMISKATEYISNGVYSQKFDYVIIDEFQDISIGRYKLIKAIKEQNPKCKIYAVGDDWQSIYRFSGSDISLFKNFEDYFGFTEKSKIETTYRFHEPLIKLSSDFILKNPNQSKKELKSNAIKSTGFKIIYSMTDNKDDTDALQEIFDELIKENKIFAEKDIYILGRYNFDINRIKNENKIFTITNDFISYKKDGNQIKATFMSVHKSKGLQAKIIIILNCNSGKYGFPSEMSDDPILNILLSEADQFENGEERRLFYVAMTRAKEKVFFVTDTRYKSKFISELEIETEEESVEKCPICKSADIVLRKAGTARNGNTYKFYGCTNYLYGCEYTVSKWINKYPSGLSL